MEANDNPPQVLFGDLYDEALNLLVEIRDHMAERRSMANDGHLEPEARLLISGEAFRMTAQLGDVMPWLLVRKAVHAGEVSQPDAASPLNRFPGASASREDRIPSGSLLSQDLRRLVKRCDDLYARVTRLDELAADGRQMPGQKRPSGDSR